MYRFFHEFRNETTEHTKHAERKRRILFDFSSLFSVCSVRSPLPF